MDSAIPYFENLPEAKWVQNFEKYSPEERERRQYGGAYDTKGKHSMIEVIRAINKFVFQPEGIELFVANRKSLLYPDVPFYDIECGPDQSR